MLGSSKNCLNPSKCPAEFEYTIFAVDCCIEITQKATRIALPGCVADQTSMHFLEMPRKPRQTQHQDNVIFHSNSTVYCIVDARKHQTGSADPGVDDPVGSYSTVD